jgi:23S rRNA (pseudouridine1915-N3)-methyltransferase
MHLTLAHIGSNSKGPFDALIALYLERCSILARTSAESFKTEAAFLQWLDKQRTRTLPVPVLLDSRGRQFTSEAFAAWLDDRRNQGAQHIVFAIGPADGWSDPARARSTLLLSLGTFTLAHALARLVLAEQLYRACTILTGHPYHSGH